jgi:hypothetical protein
MAPAKAIPAPAASIVISAEALRQAAAGQEGLVKLNLYGPNQALELASAGNYALIMPAVGVHSAAHKPAAVDQLASRL